jgi:hypothetical protein
MKFILIAVCVAATAGLYMKFRWSRPGREGIEGKWNVSSWPEGWKAMPGSHVIITGDEVKILLGVIPAKTLKYEIDREAGTIDARRYEKGETVTQLGFYEREGDTLTLSMGAEGKPRPESISSTGGGTTRWVLQAMK